MLGKPNKDGNREHSRPPLAIQGVPGSQEISRLLGARRAIININLSVKSFYSTYFFWMMSTPISSDCGFPRLLWPLREPRLPGPSSTRLFNSFLLPLPVRKMFLFYSEKQGCSKVIFVFSKVKYKANIIYKAVQIVPAPSPILVKKNKNVRKSWSIIFTVGYLSL